VSKTVAESERYIYKRENPRFK